MNMIFERDIDEVETGESLLSFKDCPNNCRDGYILDIYQHRKIKCPYCAEKRKQMARNNLKDTSSGETYQELLNLPASYKGVTYDVSTVIPESAKKVIEEQSIEAVTGELSRLLEDISIGTVPECSILFNLGLKAYSYGFIYAYLSKAYMEGVVTAPYLTPVDICNYRNREESGFNTEEDRWTYSKLLKADVCCVSVDAGATHASILAVRGLMQLRALKEKATIVFTDVWNRDVLAMCADDDSEVSLNLAKLVSVKYKEGYLREKRRQEEHRTISEASKNPMGMSTEEFNRLIGSN